MKTLCKKPVRVSAASSAVVVAQPYFEVAYLPMANSWSWRFWRGVSGGGRELLAFKLGFDSADAANKALQIFRNQVAGATVTTLEQKTA